MRQSKSLYMAVGLFVIAAFCALIILAFHMSDFSGSRTGNSYKIEAMFDNIGGLKLRAPVRIAGVTIGRVSDIELDPDTFQAKVSFRLSSEVNHIPVDSSASILTEGLLGANYISLTPGFDKTNLAEGSVIQTTHSALILEKLIGKFIYSKASGDKKN